MALKKTARELKNEAHEKAVLCAAASLFGEYGFDRVTVDDICEAAEVGKSTFYNLYKSKDDLMMVATVKSRGQYIEEHYQYEEAVPLRELLRRFFEVNFDYVRLDSREQTRQIYKGYMSTGNLLGDRENAYVVELYRLVDRGLAEHALSAALSRQEHWQLMSDAMIGCFIGWCTHIADAPGLDESYRRMLDALAVGFCVNGSK
ncbi:MAG: TetR/AcrR family transcriptional regulator [Eubacteriales bacterium]|nr:TetR/AcrR family transcriptional regulator [Eubacteriales bacterium]